MILKQLIKYQNGQALEATWVERVVDASDESVVNEVIVRCHAYSAGQMDMLRADLGNDAASHEALIAEVEAAYVPPLPPGAADLRSLLVDALNAEYERRMQVIAGGYPLSERESWHVQTSEARALLADVHALTPWINGAAAARQIDRHELAQRIAAKDDAYRAIHGALTGVRQRIEDQISAAGDDVQALADIDVFVGWPGM